MRPHRLAVPLLLAALCAADPAGARASGWDDLERRLTGGFSSEAQSREDPDYFDVRCHVLPLWRGDHDARWLYVERAVPGLPEAPYRQIVYRLGDAPTAPKKGKRFELTAYTIADPARFAGASADPAKLETMTPEDLVARPGCTVVLVEGKAGDFTGGTRGRNCPGDKLGVAYVTSEWTVEKETLRIWDRAFDVEGRQVWGATRGPYVFRRLVASSSP
jgi:hypothetical protein